METALYFPHIRVPETSWFAQILLYWDKAAAIVPYSLSTDESSVGRYMTQLRRLRHHLDGRLADLAMIEQPTLRQANADAVLDEIRDEVAVLREQMERRRWPPILMIGVGGVVGADLGAASGIATAGGTLALGLQVASGAVSMTGTTCQAARIFREPRFNKRAPLAYAALAGKL